MTAKSRITHQLAAFRATRSLVFASILVVGLLASAASVAQAAPTVVDQYTEQIPSPGGEKSPGKNSGGSDNGGTNRSGGGDSNGAAAGGSSTGGTGGGENGGNTAGAGGENGSSGSKSASGSDGSTAGTPAADGSQGTSTGSQAGNPKFASSVADGVIEEGGEGMGVVFPLILLAGMVTAGAMIFVRRRGEAGGPSVN